MSFAGSISVSALLPLVGTHRAPLLIDARAATILHQAAYVLPCAQRLVQDPGPPPAPNGIVVYCKQGESLSQGTAAQLRAAGHAARWLEGGFAAWEEAGGVLIARQPNPERVDGAPTCWVTRRRPKIDRAACPWFIQRFIDPRAEFLFVERASVLGVAASTGAIAFDIEGAPVTHDGERCSFDTLLDRYGVNDPALRALAVIVRAADTDALALAPEAAGLKAMSLGLSALEDDDHAMIRRAATLYDALYAYIRFAAKETHGWPSKA